MDCCHGRCVAPSSFAKEDEPYTTPHLDHEAANLVGSPWLVLKMTNKCKNLQQATCRQMMCEVRYEGFLNPLPCSGLSGCTSPITLGSICSRDILLRDQHKMSNIDVRSAKRWMPSDRLIPIRKEFLMTLGRAVDATIEETCAVA